jgi:hypothetical protein
MKYSEDLETNIEIPSMSEKCIRIYESRLNLGEEDFIKRKTYENW